LPNCKQQWESENYHHGRAIPPQERISMRHPLLIFCIFSILLASCGKLVPATPSTTPVSTNSIPTQISLGNCVDARQPTPDANEPSLFAPVSGKEHVQGPANAYVTVLVYSDFPCFSCAKLAVLLKSLLEKYPKNLRVVFRAFPLISKYDKSALSAQAAEAAGSQGKFWEMHDFLFSKQAEWQNKKPDEFQKWLIDQSATLGVGSNPLRSRPHQPGNRRHRPKSLG
jgi:protein-disulfide isomerase